MIPYLKVFSATATIRVTPFFQTVLNFENIPLSDPHTRNNLKMPQLSIWPHGLSRQQVEVLDASRSCPVLRSTAYMPLMLPPSDAHRKLGALAVRRIAELQPHALLNPRSSPQTSVVYSRNLTQFGHLKNAVSTAEGRLAIGQWAAIAAVRLGWVFRGGGFFGLPASALRRLQWARFAVLAVGPAACCRRRLGRPIFTGALAIPIVRTTKPSALSDKRKRVRQRSGLWICAHWQSCLSAVHQPWASCDGCTRRSRAW